LGVLAFLPESGLLTTLKVRESIVTFEKQTEVWFPEDRDQGCSIIGKFTQSNKDKGKGLTRRLVTDEGELDYLVRDTRQSGTLVGAPTMCPLGHIDSQPQYTHLRESILAYAHINLIPMLWRFRPEEATDSIIHPGNGAAQGRRRRSIRGSQDLCLWWRMVCLNPHRQTYLPIVAPAQWRSKRERLYVPMEHCPSPNTKGNRRASLGAHRHVTMTR